MIEEYYVSCNGMSMKILFLSHMFPNRKFPIASIFIAEKAEALSKNNDVKIIAPVPYFPIFKNVLPERFEVFNGLNVFHPYYLSSPLFDYRWLSYYFSVGIPIKKIVAKYDIVNVEWLYPDCYVANKIAHDAGKKVVVTVHGNEALGYLETFKRKKKYITSLQEADYIVAVSEDLKTKMTRDWRISESKIRVVPNGVNKNKFYKISKKEAREKLSLKTNKKICVCVARLSEEKSLDTLIHAISLAKANLSLFIVGAGSLENELKKLIDALHVEDRVLLIGAVPHDQIVFWLNAADFFCLSSSREGTPVVIHEALACGVPVVSTNVGGIPDIINNYHYGLLCKPGDPNSFARNLDKAVVQTWDRNKISSYGHSFTWERVARNMVDIYNEVIT